MVLDCAMEGSAPAANALTEVCTACPGRSTSDPAGSARPGARHSRRERATLTADVTTDPEAEIARSEARLAELKREEAELRARLERLRRDAADDGGEVSSSPRSPVGEATQPPTPADKIRLFRSLFRGRGDVFPRFWANAKKRKQGYAPACANEWVRGLCEKPRVKCGECPNQAFLAVDDHVIQDHLQGRHVLGVYPLLEDDTCWFLAVDFDKDGWKEDVAAFAQACAAFELPAAVERSRSGNGAHVWFFFETPVDAGAARRMGCSLITATMSSRHELRMTSYDRLFPNQDTTPRGGFGNLIALPLQYHARQVGNTVFVNERFEPIEDQWSFLASHPRIPAARVHDLARDASERGQVLGVRSSGELGEEEAKPWLRKPSRKARVPAIAGPVPAQVRAVLGQQIFVEKRGLPSPLLNQIKRLAAFQNPEFYEKQAMRLSTARTPRVIGCAEETVLHIGLPRGCRADLEELLRSHGIALVVQDERTDGEPLEVAFHGELTAVQQRAAADLLGHDAGVFVAPPGSGKTVVGAHVIAARGRSALVLVHRTQLLDQWRSQLALFLDLPLRDVGQIGGGKRKVTSRLDVAMIQSLVRRDQVDDIVGSYGQFVVDECHHVPAVSFERVMREVRARHVLGLTATPQRRDGHHPILEFQLGPLRHRIDPKSQAGRRRFEHRLFVRETSWALEASADRPRIQDLYRRLAVDAERNRMIVDDVVQALEEHRSPILLTERRDHLEFFEDQLRGVARNLVVLRGGMGVKQRREVAGQLATIHEDEERLLLATGRFIGEGFDDARLDTLFLAMPVSWRGTLVQYSGRLHRSHHGKVDVRIFDYVDRRVPMLARMFDKRLAGYRAMGYQVADARGRDEPSKASSYVIEYDDGPGATEGESL